MGAIKPEAEVRNVSVSDRQYLLFATLIRCATSLHCIPSPNIRPLNIMCSKIRRSLVTLGVVVALTQTISAQTAEWIWHPNHGQATADQEQRIFRKAFTLDGKVERAVLSVAADNHADVTVNQSGARTVNGHERATQINVTAELRSGKNVITIVGRNDEGVAGLLVKLDISLANGKRQTIVSDTSWQALLPPAATWDVAHLPADGWVAARSLGAVGIAPWGDPFKSAQATPAEDLVVPPGFKVELIHNAAADEGSWISMAVDPQGRLTISPQSDSQPLLRFTLDRKGQVKNIEPIPAPLHQAMGMCYAFGSLYVNGHGPDGTGLYRVTDTNHNDRFDPEEVQFLKKIPGEGEHGYHAVLPGPDGMLYMMNGNHTKLPDGIEPNSPHKNYQEDFLLPRLWDANGHAVGIMAPGGQLLRTDPEGKKWELLLAGFRNSYDFDFSPEGEVFTFDSDMEWDWGLPWYRPTRILHAVRGGEYGWRSGSSKWPEYYPDSLPAVVDIGIGSPTGVKFGTHSKFPTKYQRAFYAADWSYGRIIAVHLQPDGASYTGTTEEFVKGKPLNVSDFEFGKDGAMYFVTGGRGTQSGLYRVSYEGKKPGFFTRLFTREKPLVPRAEAKQAAQARKLRHQLEALQGQRDPKTVDFVWPHLGSNDRFIRYAARIALEWQEVHQWQERALREADEQTALTALLALARCGGPETQPRLLEALAQFPSAASEERTLEKLRILELSFIRQGRPDPELAARVIEVLNAHYPASSFRLNRELSQLLVYLQAPDAITKTLALLDQAGTQEEQVYYLYTLRQVKSGWSLAQREQYFGWFGALRQGSNPEITYPRGGVYNVWTNQAHARQVHPPELIQWFKDVGRDYGDGASYNKYLVRIRKDAIATLTSAERQQLQSLLEINLDGPVWKPTKERRFVKEWSMQDLLPALSEVTHGRDFANGKAAFNDAQCVACHRFANAGGSVGPELTGVGSKYSLESILESIIEPSKVVSDQYQNSNIWKKDGDDVSGRIIDENAERIIVLPNMLTPEVTVEVPTAEIARREPSKVSAMPSGLLDSLSREDILDLLAYLQAMGQAGAPNFKP